MTQQVNLYTSELRPKQQRLTLMTLLAGLLLVMFALMAVWGGIQWQRQSLAQSVASLEQQTGRLADQNRQMTAQIEARRPDPELEAALARVTQTIARRQRLLGQVENLTLASEAGFSVRMAALARQVPEDVWLTGVTLRAHPSRLVLEGQTGRAQSVPEYLEKLGDEPVFSGQTFRNFQLQRPQEPADGLWIHFRVATDAQGDEAP